MSLLTLSSSSGSTVKVDPDTPADAQPEGPGGSWTLTMSEEFNRPVTVLDADRDYVAFRPDGIAWRTRYPDYLMTDMGGQNPHTGNPQIPEQQYYATSGVSTSGGSLVLTASRNPVQTGLNPHPPFRYTSGNINSRDGHVQTYGFFEARMRLPGGVCQWPAFWTFPENWVDGVQTELDIMECFESTEQVVHTNHMPGRTVNLSPTSVLVTQWHTYGMDWSPTSVRWYVDGALRATEANASAIPSVPMYPILNLATKPRPSGDYPEQMRTEVDYVRCWSAA